MKLYCQKCKKKFRTKDDAVAKPTKCPDCGEFLVDRPVATAPSQPPPASEAPQRLSIEEPTQPVEDEFESFGAVPWQDPFKQPPRVENVAAHKEQITEMVGSAAPVAMPTPAQPHVQPKPATPERPTPAPVSPQPTEIKRPGDSKQASIDVDVQGLETIKLRANWKRKAGKLPQYLVRGQGQQLEKIVRHFANAIQRSSDHRVKLGWAAELTNNSGANRPLRIVHPLKEGHVSATDVVFRAQENDLYVRFDSTPNTSIAYLRWGLYAAVYALVAPLVIALYLYGFGAHKSWAEAYAKDHAALDYQGADKSLFYVTKITKGCYVVDCEDFSALLKGSWSVSEKDFRDSKNYLGDDIVFIGAAMLMNNSDESNWDRVFTGVYFEMLAEQCTDAEWAMLEDPNKKFRLQNKMLGQKIFDQQVNTLTRFEFSKSVDVPGFADRFCDPKKPKGAAVIQLIKSSLSRSTHFEKPWTVARLFFADPKLGLWHIGPAVFAVTFLFGLACWAIPVTTLNPVCRLLDWPTPDEFDNHVNGQPARVQSVLSDTLLYDFGVQEKDILNIAT